MKTEFNGCLIAFIGILALLCGTNAQEPDDKCVHCDDEIRNTVRMIAAVMQAMEPIRKFNVSICKVVEARGAKTIQHNNKSCLLEKGDGDTGKCYTQMLEVFFELVEVGCQLNGNPAETVLIVTKEAAKAGMGVAKAGVGAAKDMANNAKDAAKDLLGKIGIGKRDVQEENGFFINASWADVRLQVDMSICFEDDVYNVTSVEVIDNTFSGLKIWCEGGDLIDDVCHIFTGSNFVRSLNGFFVKMFAKMGLAKALQDPKIADQLATLNCGAQYED